MDISDTDQAFLDLIFDRALERLEDGLSVHPDLFLEGRSHLREQVEELIRLAEQTASSRTSDAPVVPGYSILSELGRGGMGAVYLARQQAAGGRAVALKVLPALNIMSPRARQRFLAEAHTLAQLRHPHIVTVYDVVETADAFAYSMEWVDGATLAEVLRHFEALDRFPTLSDVPRFLGNNPPSSPLIKGGGQFASPLPEGGPRGVESSETYVQFICRLGIAIGRALEAVHAVGLVHRDVKPSNILLRRDGTPLLSDFGLVREVDSTIHTQSGHFVGTAAYASPEQLRGDWDAVDGRSDVYSLGVTLYHALALRHPFASPSPSGRGQGEGHLSPLEALRRIERGAAPGIRRVRPGLPKDLETIVSKAMDPDSVRRYATVGELADDLERLLNLQPIRARPAGPVTRTVKFVRRNRKSFAGAVAGSVLALMLAAATAVYFLVLPRWSAAELTKARLTLLDPEHGIAIFIAEFFGGPGYGVTRLTGTFPAALKTALRHYDAALRLRPFDDEIRRERDVVAEVADEPAWASAQSKPRAPARGPKPAPQTASNDPTELRLIGLRSFLLADAGSAIEAWSRLDLLQDPDPFVEAALGYLYLAREEPARAYPRLREACKAFPEVGFLTVYLADAAVQCGDLAKAEQLLHRARTMPRHDPNLALDRVMADLLAAQGRDEEAEAIYERTSSSNGFSNLHHARLLESRGRLFDAVRKYREVLAKASKAPGPRRAFLVCTERWWNSLPDEERYRMVRASLDADSKDGQEFFWVLQGYAGATKRETEATQRSPTVATHDSPGRKPSLFYTTPGTVGSSATAILESGLAKGQTAIADDVISIPRARCPTCVEEQGRCPGLSCLRPFRAKNMPPKLSCTVRRGKALFSSG